MKEWPVGARVVLLAGAASMLFLAMAEVGTRDDPYAPNDWLFSHTFLAERAIESERLALNRAILTENDFADTVDDFRAEVGIARMTFYANAIWHFWNGLPLQPALLAALSALTGAPPEDMARAPVGGLVVLLLVFAAADLALRDRPGAALAPFALALACAPLVLDLRVLMPSTSVVVLALLFLLLLRRQALGDRFALAYAMVPLAMLPFWYYTVSYFVILLFVGFLGANLVMRWRTPDAPPLVPLAVAALVPFALFGGLLLNGALTSHLNMASALGSAPTLGAEAGGDYSAHLNRQPWRSGLLYLELALLFAPLAWLGLDAALRIARGRSASAADAAWAQWCAGGALFSIALPSVLGASFLNRSAIYLAPVAAVALAVAASRSRAGRRVAFAALAVGALATPALVATAAPSYSAADGAAFAWMEENVPKDRVVYSALDVASVLFRAHGYHDTLAFHPRTSLLEDFWYGTDPAAMRPYLASVDWFVLRDEVRTSGFEEFGPLREPVSDEAFAKFAASPDLWCRFDNGEVRVYEVDIHSSSEPGRRHPYRPRAG